MADQRGVAGAQMHRAWHSCSMLCLLWVHHMVAATSSAGSKDNVMVKAADSIVWSDHAFVPELAERTQDAETENETVYVSIVAAGRNDQYGGRFVERVQLFIDSVVAFACAAFAGAGEAQIELVLVDYNTPVGNPELKDALLWPSGCQELRVRSVYVPPGVHARLTNPNKLSFFEHIAKNVGLRAARGEYVLVTNPDILLNEDVFSWLARRTLQHAVLYRIDRHDLGPGFKPPGSAISVGSGLERVRSLLSACLAMFEQVQVSAAGGLWSVVGSVPRRDYLHTMRGGGYAVSEEPRPVVRPAQLHTMAAGDFTLMAAHDWQRLQGYPEAPTNMELDSHMCVLAIAAGLRQAVLQAPRRIFHQFHGGHERAAREMSERDREGSVGHRMWQMIGYLLAGHEERTRLGRTIVVALNGGGWGLCCMLASREREELTRSSRQGPCACNAH